MNQEKNRLKKYIFITGGVLSSLGKGISAASLGMLLEQRGLSITMIKMDPYLNVDPGTMSPFQHGEVFVLEDGSETDLDLGHYARFVQKVTFSKKNSFTTGRVYEAVIRREREGGYLGETVQVIPHITDEIKRLIRTAAEGVEVAIIEVGGTVGDIESLPFLEAIRQMKVEEGFQQVLFIHLTLVPYLGAAAELKTKPTQHSVKELREIGIQPDFLLCRSDRKLPHEVKHKIGLFCNVSAQQVISAVDVQSIYEIPLYFHEEGLDEKIIQYFQLQTQTPDLSDWETRVQRLKKPKSHVQIGIVGKYTDWKESYKSLSEALVHAGLEHHLQVSLTYLEAESFESCSWEELHNSSLKHCAGLLVPGGFGSRGVEGKLKAIEYARIQGIPFFGICLGMQLAVIEIARHVAGLTAASSEEFTPQGFQNVIHFIEHQRDQVYKGGSMRLGSYQCDILSQKEGRKTLAFDAYQTKTVHERHRHRFEVSSHFLPQLEKAGLVVSGWHTPDHWKAGLVEIVEWPDHPWFLGCQFHPEFLSSFLKPHPLFVAFVQKADERRRLIK